MCLFVPPRKQSFWPISLVFLDFRWLEKRLTLTAMDQNNGKRHTGRPTKRNPEVINRILEIARTGLPMRFVATAGGISVETLSEWREHDPKFASEFAQAQLESVKRRWNLIQKAARGTEDNPGDWKAAAWSLERTFPREFGRPEVQVAIQNNTVVNDLTINISEAEAREIEAKASPVREAVAKMFEQYRPREAGNGERDRESAISESVRQKFTNYRAGGR